MVLLVQWEIKQRVEVRNIICFYSIYLLYFQVHFRLQWKFFKNVVFLSELILIFRDHEHDQIKLNNTTLRKKSSWHLNLLNIDTNTNWNLNKWVFDYFFFCKKVCDISTTIWRIASWVLTECIFISNFKLKQFINVYENRRTG